MSPEDRTILAAALGGSFGTNDAGDEVTRLDSLRQRFKHTHALLINHGAAFLDQTEDDVAFELIRVLARVLRAGAADHAAQGLLANFLCSIQDSEHIIARRVLGLEVSGGRASNELARVRAIEAFKLWTEEG